MPEETGPRTNEGHTHPHALSDGHGDVLSDVHGVGHGQTLPDAKTADALLQYMLDHNRHHAEELHSLAHQLDALGRDEAAEAVSKALALYQQGNAELMRAVEAH